MANKKSSIGDVPTSVDAPVREFLGAVKDNIEQMTGRGHGLKPLTPLVSTATTAQIISKVNDIINRLNG